MKRKQKGSDICFCGDYRSQYCRPAPPWRDTARGGFCFCGCSEFKWGRRATVEDQKHWDKYHKKGKTK